MNKQFNQRNIRISDYQICDHKKYDWKNTIKRYFFSQKKIKIRKNQSTLIDLKLDLKIFMKILKSFVN